MAKIRVHALAKELGISSSDLLKILEKIDIQAKSNLSSLDEKEVSKVKQAVKSGKQTAKAEATKAKKSPAKNSQAKKLLINQKRKRKVLPSSKHTKKQKM
ncbi:translation initiation factor IF-2, N-terminal domain protein [Peptoniphilus sp. oral taxon 375 str. F0436]|nr:translation initiation factor IF-2, N-terminal domain protein [Peptoniphilus sp. oral taxon 375 str. F0436]